MLTFILRDLGSEHGVRSPLAVFESFDASGSRLGGASPNISVSMGTAPTGTRARTREHFLRSGESGFYEAGGPSLRVGPATAAHLIPGVNTKGASRQRRASRQLHSRTRSVRIGRSVLPPSV